MSITETGMGVEDAIGIAWSEWAMMVGEKIVAPRAYCMAPSSSRVVSAAVGEGATVIGTGEVQGDTMIGRDTTCQYDDMQTH